MSSDAKADQPVRDFFRYWWRVVLRACSECWGFVKDNWRKWFWSAVGLSIAYIPFSCLTLPAKATEKVLWWAVITGAELATIWLVFPFYLLRAPWLMEKEMIEMLQNQMATLRSELHGQIDQQQGQIDQQQGRIAQLETRDNEHRKASVESAEQQRVRAMCRAALAKLKDELPELSKNIREWFQTFGPVDYVNRIKTRLAEWLRRARAEAGKVSQADHLAQESEIDELPTPIDKPRERQVDQLRNFTAEAEKFVQRQIEAINTILRQLG